MGKKSLANKFARHQIESENFRHPCGCVNNIDGRITYCLNHQGLSDTDRRKLELWGRLVSALILWKKFSKSNNKLDGVIALNKTDELIKLAMNLESKNDTAR